MTGGQKSLGAPQALPLCWSPSPPAELAHFSRIIFQSEFVSSRAAERVQVSVHSRIAWPRLQALPDSGPLKSDDGIGNFIHLKLCSDFGSIEAMAVMSVVYSRMSKTLVIQLG